MPDRVTIIGLILSVSALLFVLELVRRRQLREDYSLLWLGTALVLIALTAFRPLLDRFAALLGVITYPPAVLFAVAILFVLSLLLHFSTVLTRLTRENREIAQQMAILRWELSEARKQLATRSDDQDADQRDAVN